MSEKLSPGEARAPGHTYQEAIQKDASEPPPSFLTESYEFLGDADILPGLNQPHRHPVYIAQRADDAMAVMAEQIGFDQSFRNLCGLALIRATALKNGLGEVA